ncbi:MAG: hypothetical protein AAF503_01095, partial [Pseudomonadota bacterium]
MTLRHQITVALIATGLAALTTVPAMAQLKWDVARQDDQTQTPAISFVGDPELKARVSAYLDGLSGEEGGGLGPRVASQSAEVLPGENEKTDEYFPPGYGDQEQRDALLLKPVRTMPLAVAEQTELVVPRDPHLAAYKTSPFPSAIQCAECHQKIFWEWASSNHAYASVSPMFHKFEQRLNTLASGTVGTFCVRCHQQIG